jgi:uncharacterized protein
MKNALPRHAVTRVLLPVALALLLLAPGAAHRGESDPPVRRASDNELVAVELSTVGLDRVAGVPVVLLRDPESGRVLPIWVGMAEAQAIALALHGVVVPRPMTHDLMASLLSELQAEVEEVVVHDLRENTYIGTVRLRVAGESELRDVDSRPSDALALAMRTGALIRVARKILVEAPPFDFVAPDGPSQVVRALGITVVAATAALRAEFDLPDRPGVVVMDVSGRALAEGLRRGDLIVGVNGQDIEEPMDFFERIRATAAGERVRIAYWRDGEERQIDLPADLPLERRRRGTVVA